MALPDYFTFYNLPESFFPNKESVRKQYYAASREHHPDRAPAGDDKAANEALQMSALNNEAYRTLSDTYKTMGYILKHHGIIEDEEAYKLPPAFLMDMMELNEAVGNADMAPDMAQDARREYDAALSDWSAAIAPFTQRFESGERTPELFATLKEYYYRKKYLLRVKDRLK